jgi:hypothetical protein
MTTGPQCSRIPGRSGVFIRDSLWKAEDHVLSVRRNPFSESYRRYYFADVQAIVLTELSNSVAPYAAVLAVCLISLAAGLVYTRHLGWGILSGLLALVAFYLSWRLPTCACYIKTSVSTEKLQSLAHLRGAQKALLIIRAEIEKVQGSANPEMFHANPPLARTDSMHIPTSRLTPPLRHSTGVMHWIAFALLLLRGALAIITLGRMNSSIPFNAVVGAVGTGALLFLIFAAIQQRRSDMTHNVRVAVYAALAWYVASGLAAFAVGIYLGVQLGLNRVNSAVLAGAPAFKVYELVVLIGYLILGCTGLLLMARHQRAVRTPPPLAVGNGG